MFDMVPRWLFYGTIILYLAIVGGIIVAFGDDDEDRGRPSLYDQLLKRAQEWNIQTVINETLATAERFK